MTLVVTTLSLLAITFLCFIAGTIWLSQYAARLGTGPRVMTLLFPPYAFYFAFYKLDQEQKYKPVFLWSFGVVSTVLLALMFAQPLGYYFSTGDTKALDPDAPGQEQKVAPTEAPKPADKPADAAAPAAPAADPAAAPADGAAAPAAPADGAAAPAAPAAPADAAAPAAPAAPADAAAPAAPAPAAPAAPAADPAAAPK